MSSLPRKLSLVGALALALAGLPSPLAAASTAPGGTGLPSPGGGGASTGGAPISSGGLAPTGGPKKVPAPPSKHDRGQWLRGVTITEYWPAPEAWFVGRLVKAPGLTGLHRIDWLYSASGLSMEGDGIGLDGQLYHIQSLGDGGWVTASGRSTDPSTGWRAGAPFWRAGGYWRNRKRAVTYPLAAGGWSAGFGRQYVPLLNVSFAAGQSLSLHYYESIAVDPNVIPLGSRVYVPAYRNDGHGGWFIAADTGGAINGRHIDVYRSPPASSSDSGQYLSGARMYVIKARH
jgi:hypothetical protein